MRNILLSLILIIAFTFSFGIMQIEASAQQFKVVNGDAGLELLLKGNCRLQKILPIVYRDDILTQLYYGAYIGIGMSEQYTAPRNNIYAFNHYGDRFDWSIGVTLEGFDAIYTHSVRNKYSGASPDVLFFNQDVDSIKLRFTYVL